MDIILNIEYSGFLKKTTRFHEKYLVKGQLISKANCQAVNSSKKQTNEFIFTSMQRVFVCFLEELEDFKKTFQNYLTFRWLMNYISCFQLSKFVQKIFVVDELSCYEKAYFG